MSIMGGRCCAIAWSGTRRSAAINLGTFITVTLFFLYLRSRRNGVASRSSRYS
jgi:hypothetical protein